MSVDKKINARIKIPNYCACSDMLDNREIIADRLWTLRRRRLVLTKCSPTPGDQ